MEEFEEMMMETSPTPPPWNQDGSGDSDFTGWQTLPNICLQNIFRFLQDADRKKASLVCHTWYDVMQSPCLWRSRSINLSGRMSLYRPSEQSLALGYLSRKGKYLMNLELVVCPPQTNVVAQRLLDTLCCLLHELVRVKAPLQSFAITNLNLDCPSWESADKNTIMETLIPFLKNGIRRLRVLRLHDMRNATKQGLNLLSMLSEELGDDSYYNLSILDLRGFFSSSVSAYPNDDITRALIRLPPVTELGFSYSCITGELLQSLGDRNQRSRRIFRAPILHSILLHLTQSEGNNQVVNNNTWQNLTATSSDLTVKIVVEDVTNNDWLANVLLPGIPCIDFNMTAKYNPLDQWSPRVLFNRIMPPYRHRLKVLNLDLNYSREPIGRELAIFIDGCESLEDLRIWAFLDFETVEKLLHIAFTKKSLFKIFQLRIYSMSSHQERRDFQMQTLINYYRDVLDTEVEFFAEIYPLG